MASESYVGNSNIPEKLGEDVNDIPLGEQSEKSAACLKVEPTTKPGTVNTALEDSSYSNKGRKSAPTDCRLMSSEKNHSSSSTEATEHPVVQTKEDTTRPEVEEKPLPMNSPLQRAKKSLLGSEANATVISEVAESPNLSPSEPDEVKIEPTAEPTKQPSEQITKQCIKERDEGQPMISLSQPDQNSLANSNADSIVNVTVEPADMLLCKSEDVKVESTTKFIEQPAEQIAVGTAGLSVIAVPPPPPPMSPLMQFYFPDDEPNEPLVSSSIADAPVVDDDVEAAQLPLCKSKDAKVESTTRSNEQPAELVEEDTKVPDDVMMSCLRSPPMLSKGWGEGLSTDSVKNDGLPSCKFENIKVESTANYTELPAGIAKEGVTDPSDVVRPLPPKSPPLPNETWLEGTTAVSVINGAIETAELPSCKSEDAKVESTTKLSDEPAELAPEYAAVPDDVVRLPPRKSPPLPNQSWHERLTAYSFINDAIEITRSSSCTSEDAKVESIAISAEQPAEMVKENTAFPNDMVRSSLPKLPLLAKERWHDGLTADSFTSYAIETSELPSCNYNDCKVELNSESSEQPAEMAKDDTAVPNNLGRPSLPKSPPLSNKSWCEGLTADSVRNYTIETVELVPCNSNDSKVESTSKSLEQPAEMAKEDTAVLNEVGKPSPPKSPPLPNKSWCEGLKAASSVIDSALETTELPSCNSDDAMQEYNSKSSDQPAELVEEDTIIPNNVVTPPKSPLPNKSCHKGLAASAAELAELALCASESGTNEPAEIVTEVTASCVVEPLKSKSPPMKFYLSTNLPKEKLELLIAGLDVDVTVTINDVVENADLSCKSECGTVKFSSKSLRRSTDGTSSRVTSILNGEVKPADTNYLLLTNKKSEVTGGFSGTGSVHSDQQEETPQFSGSQPVEFSCNPQSKKASNKTPSPQRLGSPQFGEQLMLVREQQNKKPFESTPGDGGKMPDGLQISDGLEASTPSARVHIIPSPEKEDTVMLDSVSEQLGQISVSPFCPSLADLTVECDEPFLSDNRPSLGEEFHEDDSHKFVPSPKGSALGVNSPAKTVETEVSNACVEHSDSLLASFNQARVSLETIHQLKKCEKMVLSLTDQLRKATNRRSAAGRREISKQPGTRDLPEISSDRVKELERDLSQTQQHLQNMKVAFNDLHQKYQKSKEVIAKSKEVIAKYKEDEIALKKYVDSAMENLEKQKQSHEKFKTMAMKRLNKANKEIARIRAEFTPEVEKSAKKK